MAVMTNGGDSISFLCAFILMISETKGVHCEPRLRRGGGEPLAQPPCAWNVMASMMSRSCGGRRPSGAAGRQIFLSSVILLHLYNFSQVQEKILRIRAAPKDSQVVNNRVAAPEGSREQGSWMSVKKGPRGAGHSITLSEPDWRKSRLRCFTSRRGRKNTRKYSRREKHKSTVFTSGSSIPSQIRRGI